jgi:hypothetical protein
MVPMGAVIGTRSLTSAAATGRPTIEGPCGGRPNSAGVWSRWPEVGRTSAPRRELALSA